MRFVVNAGLLVFLWCVVQAANAGPTYPIVLERASRVGLQYHIAVTGSKQTTMMVSAGGKAMPSQGEVFNMQLEGTVEVLKIDALKRPIKKAVTVDRCVKLVDDTDFSLIKPGTIVIAAVVDDNESYTIDDKPVSEDLQEALKIAISLPIGDITNDEMFGAREPKHVGESWNITAAKCANSAKKQGTVVAVKDISGQSTLKEVVTVNGQSCLRIATQMQMKNLKLVEFSTELTMKSVGESITSSCILPVDASQGPIEAQQLALLQIVAESQPVKDAPLTIIKMTMKHSVTTKYSDVK